MHPPVLQEHIIGRGVSVSCVTFVLQTVGLLFTRRITYLEDLFINMSTSVYRFPIFRFLFIRHHTNFVNMPAPNCITKSQIHHK